MSCRRDNRVTVVADAGRETMLECEGQQHQHNCQRGRRQSAENGHLLIVAQIVNWADVPSVIRLDDGTLAADWLQKTGPETYAYDVRLSYSQDDGKSWAAAFTPHHDARRPSTDLPH